MALVKGILNQFKQEGFQRYFKNTSWLFAEKILRLLSGLVVGVIVARYLGPEQFGLLNYAMSFVGLFLALSSLGLDSILVRDLVKNPEESGSLLGTAFRMKLIAALAVMLLLIISVIILDEEEPLGAMLLVIGLTALFQSVNVIDFYFQAKVQSKYVVKSNVIALSITAIIKVLLVFLQADLFYFAAVFSLDAFIIGLGLLYFYFDKREEKQKWQYNKQTAKKLLKSSWPLILASLVVTVYMKIDQIMITEMLSPTANGNYAAAVRISEAWYFVPMIIASSLFPAIINAKSKMDGSYENRLQQLYDFMVLISVLVALPVTILGPFIIDFLYGAEYSQAADVLIIHIWSGIFVALGLASSSWLISEDLQKLSMLRTSLGALANIALNFWLIPKYGIIGAALTTLVSQIIAALLFDLLYKRTRPTFFMKLKSLLFLSIFNKILKIEK